MKYINHITLNSGHFRKTYPKEVNKELYFILKRLYRDSLKGETEIFDGYKMKSTKSNVGVTITVYNPNKLPILTVAISRNDKGELWRLLHQTATMPLATNENEMPETPYIADRIEIGAIQSLGAMNWTGDFAKCMGWIALYPNKIR